MRARLADRRLQAGLGLALAVAACACREQRAERQPTQLAILPTRNLSADNGLRWIEGAAPAALAYDLAGSHRYFARQASSLSDAFGAGATEVLDTRFDLAAGGIRLYAALEDLPSRKTVRTLERTAPSKARLLPLIDSVAKDLDSSARPFGTRSAAALETYGRAMLSTDPGVQISLFQSALNQDPQFTEAAVQAAERTLAAQDRAGAFRIASEALPHAQDPIERANLEFIIAAARSNLPGQAAALAALVSLTPSNPSIELNLAQARLAERKYSAAAAGFRNALARDPSNPEIWNQLGYAEAFARNFPAARKALESYNDKLDPKNANGLDSLGEVSLFSGDFKSAEDYFLRAVQKSVPGRAPDELLKAAQARLLSGGLSGAEGRFAEYLKYVARVQPALAQIQNAQWMYLTGRTAAAISALDALKGTALSSYAHSQLAVWRLLRGDSLDAEKAAAEAARTAVGPNFTALASVAQALCKPGAAAASPLTQASALLLHRRFEEALPTLENLYRDSQPTADAHLRILLAWAYSETGHVEKVEPLVALYALPLPAGDWVLAPLTFPRSLFLRAQAEAHAGKQSAAKKDYELFLKLSGDAPGIFGEIQKARQAL